VNFVVWHYRQIIPSLERPRAQWINPRRSPYGYPPGEPSSGVLNWEEFSAAENFGMSEKIAPRWEIQGWHRDRMQQLRPYAPNSKLDNLVPTWYQIVKFTVRCVRRNCCILSRWLLTISDTNQWLLNCILVHRYQCALWLRISVCNK